MSGFTTNHGQFYANKLLHAKLQKCHN